MIIITLMLFILGLIIGSFLNVVIFRMNLKKTFLGRSICLSCMERLPWYDNIPLFSFVVLKKKCRFCQSVISWQYPAVELATAAIFVIGFLRFNIGVEYLSFIIFSCFLIIIFVYDLKHYLILDKISIPAMIVALFFNLNLGYSFLELILGAVIIAGFFYLQLVVSKGKWIGGGDIRLGAVMGFMLGWKIGLVALFLAYFLGAIIGIILLTSGKKKMSSQIPFGTFLSLATVISLLILNWYINLLKF